MRRHIYKTLLTFVFLLTASCSTGDLPSISIQPSQDIYEQDAVKRTSSMDILWVIDNSNTFKPFQDKIRENFVSFLDDFTSKKFNDFQVGVTVTDGFLDFDFDTFKEWNKIDAPFSASDLPCKDKDENEDENENEDETSDCYDYVIDFDARFKFGTKNSILKHTNCDVCYGDPSDKSTIGHGREISILTNLVLDELKLICEIVNNDDNTNNNCEDTDAPGVAISGDKKFLDLFDQIIVNVGIGGSFDERVMQSIQAARLNKNNKDLFREKAHLAVIIASDEDDTSVNTQKECTSNPDDNSGVIYCPNLYPVKFYKDLLELATDKEQGVTIHNIGINPKGDGYQSDYFKSPEFLEVFKGSEDARTAYMSGMNNNYDDNASVVTSTGVIATKDLDYRTNRDAPFKSWTDNDPERKECRTIKIPEIDKEDGSDKIGEARFFSRRNTELAESSNGIVASLCADFAESLKKISIKIIEATSEFFLGDDNIPSQAILDQGLVFVAIRDVGEELFRTIDRDKTRTNGWDYNADNNSIVFFGNAVPENKSEVSIVFDRENF